VPATLGDLMHLFPDLSKRLGDVDRGLRLLEVRDFSARELVITGATVTLAAKSNVRAECALIVWYDENGSATEPAAVEFSFRYGNALGVYGGKVARRAFEIFAIAQNDLTAWLDPHPRTKTAFVYG
jgi:hypothetical protein